MQRRICEKCGTEFNWESLEDEVQAYVRRAVLKWGAFCAIALVVYLILYSWVSRWIILVIDLLVLAYWQNRPFINTVATVRKCPSCGSPGVARESPLGKELKARWKDAHAEASVNETALLYCASSKEVVRSRIQAGADVNGVTNAMGRTPLIDAAQSNSNPAIVAELIQAGARVNVGDNEGRTPLMWAARDGRAAVVKVLLRCGADVNAKDSAGATPLLWAVNRSDPSPVVALLLRANADVHAKDRTGATPLDAALRQGHGSTVKLLMDAGAKATSKQIPA